MMSIMPYKAFKKRHTASLNLVTASISPSIQEVRELHALSPPLAARYALDNSCND